MKPQELLYLVHKLNLIDKSVAEIRQFIKALAKNNDDDPDLQKIINECAKEIEI